MGWNSVLTNSWKQAYKCSSDIPSCCGNYWQDYFKESVSQKHVYNLLHQSTLLLKVPLHCFVWAPSRTGEPHLSSVISKSLSWSYLETQKLQIGKRDSISTSILPQGSGMQRPYGKVDWSYTQGEEKSGERRPVSTVQKTVSMCRYGKLKNCFQLPFPQKSYTEPKAGETPPFLFITMLSYY